ncbi:TasA family protein [Salarchaeum japonicum]|uniref:TasA family protein n=1 Tax=Salarchaeum japonicum TaxID=555573 RepID=A0AAV3T0J9_9EURY|nr:TasA family protein [Salarchaeum japonicum]
MSRTIKLTRRRVLASLLVISLAAAGAGAGTMAYFSDTETSTDNTVSAGTLDLQLDDGDSDVTLVEVSEAAPGDSGSTTLNVSNNGTIDGTLSIDFDVSSAENGIVEPEEGVDNSPSDSELPENLQVKLTSDDAPNVGWVNASDLGTYSEFATLEAGEEVEYTVEWRIVSDAGNEIQSDSATVNATITLDQETDE